MRLHSSLLAITALSLTHCGRDHAETREVTANASTSQILSDDTLLSESVTSQIDEAISAAAIDQSSEAGFQLVSRDRQGKMTIKRTCEASEGMAVVSITHTFNRSREGDNAVRSWSMTMDMNGSQTRTWSKEGEETFCSESGRSEEIELNEMQGVTLDMSFSRSRSREMTLTNKRRGTTYESSHSLVANGERSITWTDVQIDESELAVTRSMTSRVERELTLKNSRNQDKTLTLSIATKVDAPLNATTLRDAASMDVISRTIHSGTTIGSTKDNGRVETTYSEVKYTSAGGCMPVSGSISGSIFEAGTTEAKLTYSISFLNENATIEFSDGRSLEYAPEGCDLEQDGAEVEEI